MSLEGRGDKETACAKTQKPKGLRMVSSLVTELSSHCEQIKKDTHTKILSVGTRWRATKVACTLEVTILEGKKSLR